MIRAIQTTSKVKHRKVDVFSLPVTLTNTVVSCVIFTAGKTMHITGLSATESFYQTNTHLHTRALHHHLPVVDLLSSNF